MTKLHVFEYTKETLQSKMGQCKSVSDFLAFRSFLEMDGYIFVSKQNNLPLESVNVWPPQDNPYSTNPRVVKLEFKTPYPYTEGPTNERERVLCYIRNILRYTKIINRVTHKEV